MTTQTIGMTRFASRHFNPEFTATKISSHTPEEIVEMVNQAIADGAELVDGFAPFVKHLFLPNPTDAKMGIAKITPENKHLLKSGYLRRNDTELRYLARWFEGLKVPQANYLDFVLYSRAALEEEADKKEEKAKEDGKEPGERDVPDADWGIVAINGEPLPQESPMSPATMERNHMGQEWGGNGAPIDQEKHDEATEFFNEHATVK